MADPDLIRALSDLTLAVRGGLQMTTRSGDRSSDFFRPFASLTTITGTTGDDIWTPASGARFYLKGAYVLLVVHTALNATPGVRFDLIDSGSSKVIAPLGGAAPTAAAGTVICAVRLDLAEGVKGSAVNAKVQIQASVTIDSGKVSASGILWGEELTA